jgi:hypothetical protein
MPGATAITAGMNRPPGAYVSDPSLSGRALFSFEASREKGEGVPQGRVTFALGAADFAFESVACDSITLSNAAAWLEGRGTVNGRGDYGYMLIVYDNQPTIPFGDQRALLASVGGGSIEIQAQRVATADASTEQ